MVEQKGTFLLLKEKQCTFVFKFLTLIFLAVKHGGSPDFVLYVIVTLDLVAVHAEKLCFAFYEGHSHCLTGSPLLGRYTV